MLVKNHIVADYQNIFTFPTSSKILGVSSQRGQVTLTVAHESTDMSAGPQRTVYMVQSDVENDLKAADLEFIGVASPYAVFITPAAEETPAEETPAEETPAEETPAEETPAEETPAEETPAEEVTKDE